MPRVSCTVKLHENPEHCVVDCKEELLGRRLAAAELPAVATGGSKVIIVLLSCC